TGTRTRSPRESTKSFPSTSTFQAVLPGPKPCWKASSSSSSGSRTRTWPPAGEVSRLSSTESDVQTEEPTQATPDPALQRLLDGLTRELGDAVVGRELRSDDLWVRVRRDEWGRTATVCRSLGLDYFCFLSGIDWMPATQPNPEEAAADTDVSGLGDDDEQAAPAEEEAAQPAAEAPAAEEGIQTGVAGGDSRFQVLARLYSTADHVGVTLKA